MKPIKIDPTELQKWMHKSWQVYASDSSGEMLKRFWVNCNGWYRVVLGADEIFLYEGSRITHALAAWEQADMFLRRLR